MQGLLKLARLIDAFNTKLGWIAAFACGLAAAICAANAFIRYGLSISSNAFLEVQWYLFAACVMLGAAYVLKANEHVRVDLIYGKMKGNGQPYIDIFGIVVFLLPVMAVLAWLSWPYFLKTFVSGEMSSNAGGLIRWPAVLTLPVGFALVFLQGISELIKRIGHVTGVAPMDTHYERPLQ